MMASNNSTTPDTKYEMVDTLTDGFGVLMNQGQETTVENYYATDEYREFVETMYDWQQKGYLSKDAATTTEGVENQVKAGAAFVRAMGRNGTDFFPDVRHQLQLYRQR